MAIFSHSGSYDHLHHGFSLALGALALGRPVRFFFTYWSLRYLKRGGDSWFHLDAEAKDYQPVLQKGLEKGHLEKISEMITQIKAMGGEVYVCTPSIGLLNIARDELVESVDRLPGHATFCVKFIEGEAMLIHLNLAGIAVTSGSTCSSQALKVSHVLEAIGTDPLWAQGSVVFTLGIENTGQEVDICLEALSQTVERLPKFSPLVGAKNFDRFRYRKG